MLPPGPSGGPLAQTVRLHRDPLGTLRDARDRYGDVFTIRLATARPILVVAAAGEVPGLLEAGCAGEARRRILPMASPRSVFGGDGEQHAMARRRVAAAFTRAAVERHRPAMAEIAARHVDRWPERRPFRCSPGSGP